MIDLDELQRNSVNKLRQTGRAMILLSVAAGIFGVIFGNLILAALSVASAVTGLVVVSIANENDL